MKRIVFNILGSLMIFTLLVVESCRKDKGDSSPPEIVISNPFDGQQFSEGDTVQVDFSISDNNSVSTITVTLVDANLSPALPSLTVSPTSANASYTVLYPLNDIHLNSGLYYISVGASDGYNSLSKYRKVNISASPKKRVEYYFVTHPNVNLVQVSRLDTMFVQSPYYQVTGDLSNSDISSYNQCIYTAGSLTGKVNAINTGIPALRWSLPVFVSSSPYFEYVYNTGTMTYVSFYSGLIKGYDASGGQRFLATVNNGFYPVKLFLHNGSIVTETRDVSSSARKIILYQASTGAGLQECGLNQDVISFNTLDNDNILTLGNNAGQGMMEIYQVSTNGFWSPHVIPAGKILSVAEIDPDTYLIGHSNGTIYRYTYSNNSLITYMTGVTASHISYDDVNQELLVSQNNLIKQFDYSSAALLNNVNVTDSVYGLHILFNK